tara:strand:+ start:7967 stop:8899 length:933 start_codon:yes stop_codon:yes gene_type:complete
VSVVTLTYYITIQLIFPSTYTSTSVIAIKDNNQGFNASSLFSLISVPPAALQQMQVFLESEEALNIIKNSFPVKEFYTLSEGGLFKSYNILGLEEGYIGADFNSYLRDKISIEINREANTISINSTTFNPEYSKKLNIALIGVANFYFTRKKNVAASITKINKECELLLSKSDIEKMPYEANKDPQNIDLENINSGNELLYNLAAVSSKKCKNIFNDFENLQVNEKGYDSSTVYFKNLSTEGIRNAMKGIFQNSVDLLTNSDNLVIVSEPQSPIAKDEKRALLKSALLFFVLLLSFFSLNTLRLILFEFR